MKKILMPILALGLSAVVGVTFGFGATAEDGSLGKRTYGANVDKGSVTAVGKGSSSYQPTELQNPKFDEHPDLFGTGKSISDIYTYLNNKLDEAGYQSRFNISDKPSVELADAFFTEAGVTSNKGISLCFVVDNGTMRARILPGVWNSGPQNSTNMLVNGIYVKDTDGNIIEYDLGRLPDLNWKTTEPSSQGYCGIESRFEWLNRESSKNDAQGAYGNPYKLKLQDADNPFVELNAKSPATFYQDLSTNGGDIIIWGLEHATRSSGASDQIMQVSIGGAGSTPGATDLPTVYTYSGIDPSHEQNGSYAAGDLDNLKMRNTDTVWKNVKGIYIVPGTGVSTTRFAFESKSTSSVTEGNYMDNVIFQTLAGNISVTNTDDGGVKIEGYWGGDPDKPKDDPDNKLELTLKGNDGNDYNIVIDMSGVNSGNDFEAEIPASTIEDIKTQSGGVTNGDVHHKTYGTPGSGTPITLVDPVKVTFDKKGHGTTDPATQSMAPGKKATTPGGFVVGSEYDGYKFLGWYVNESDTTPFDFNNAIMADTHLIAKWETASGSGITPSPSPSPSPGGGSSGGSSGGGSSRPLNVPSATAPGTTVDKAPAAPAPTTQEAPADTSESIPTVETAPAPAVTVTFQSDLGNIPAPQTMTPGQTAYNPGAPLDPATLAPGTVINGQRFEGWYTDPSFKNAYRFGDPVTEDMVLYAKWTKVGTGAGRSPKTADNNWLFILLAGAMGILSVTGIKLVKTKKRDRFS